MRRLPCRHAQRDLDLLADGRATRHALEDIRAHIAICDGCRREHRARLRLRSALADQPCVTPRTDALERLRARLKAEGRPTPRLHSPFAAIGLAVVAVLTLALPLVLRQRGEPYGPLAPGVASSRPAIASTASVASPRATARAIPGRTTERARPVPPAGERPRLRVPRVRAPIADSPAAPPAQASPKPDPGSMIVIIVMRPEARSQPTIAVRAAGIGDAEGVPEATVTTAETFGADGALRHLDYGYDAVRQAGAAAGTRPEAVQEGVRDDFDGQNGCHTGASDRGSGLHTGPDLRRSDTA